MPTEVLHVVNDKMDTFEVRQRDYFGNWASFSDEQVAINFARWLDENFDTDGIILRLHGAGNTPDDLEQIRIIKRRALHVTNQVFPGETLAHKFHRERGTPDWD